MFFAMCRRENGGGTSIAGLAAQAAIAVAREGATYRPIRHVAVRGDERHDMVPGTAGCEHVGEFDYRDWPPRVCRELAAAAEDAGCAGAYCHLNVTFDGTPTSWWTPIRDLESGVNRFPQALDRWLVCESLTWAATIDEYGVFRVFGSERLVTSVRERYRRDAQIDG